MVVGLGSWLAFVALGAFVVGIVVGMVLGCIQVVESLDGRLGIVIV